MNPTVSRSLVAEDVVVGILAALKTKVYVRNMHDDGAVGTHSGTIED
jgi:hypothetical protein